MPDPMNSRLSLFNFAKTDVDDLRLKTIVYREMDFINTKFRS